MSSVWNGITDGEVQASSEARPSSRQCGPGGPSEAARARAQSYGSGFGGVLDHRQAVDRIFGDLGDDESWWRLGAGR